MEEEKIVARQKHAISVANEVYVFIKMHPDTTVKDVANALAVNSSLVYAHVKLLHKARLLTMRKEKKDGHITAHYKAVDMQASQRQEDGTKNMTAKPIKRQMEERFEAFIARGVFDDQAAYIQPYFRYNIGGVNCVAASGIVAVTGKPGAGKTTALALLVGILLGHQSWGEVKCVKPCNRVLWIDTEKPIYSCQQRMKVLRKVAELATKSLEESGIDFYLMKNETEEDRRYFIERLSRLNTYDVIVIDGIFDLTKDPDKDYMPVIDLLKRLSDNETTVFAMLHTNKKVEDDNMRYALGTELMRICTNRFLVKYDTTKKCHAIVHDKSNDTEYAPPILYNYKEDGTITPIKLGKDAEKGQNVQQRQKQAINAAFAKILACGAMLRRTELIKAMKEKCGISEDAAIKRIKTAKREGVIKVSDNGKYYYEG